MGVRVPPSPPLLIDFIEPFIAQVRPAGSLSGFEHWIKAIFCGRTMEARAEEDKLPPRLLAFMSECANVRRKSLIPAQPEGRRSTSSHNLGVRAASIGQSQGAALGRGLFENGSSRNR